MPSIGLRRVFWVSKAILLEPRCGARTWPPGIRPVGRVPKSQHYSRTAPPARSSRCGRRPPRVSAAHRFLRLSDDFMAEPSLGVALIALNASARLAQCLTALSFADDVVVIDGGSTDDTVAIAQAHGARVIVERDWPGFGPQKNRALDALDTDWILSSIPTKSSPRNSRNRSATRSARRPRRSMRSTACRASAASGSITAAGIRTGSRACSGAAPRASDDLVHERLVFDGARSGCRAS